MYGESEEQRDSVGDDLVSSHDYIWNLVSHCLVGANSNALPNNYKFDFLILNQFGTKGG